MSSLRALALGLGALAAACGVGSSRAGWVAAPPWAAHVIDSEGVGADGVRPGDFDGDGLTDLASAWEEEGEVRIYRNPGPEAARERWPRTVVGRVGSAEDALPVDVDGDGRLDLLSATEGATRTLFLHRRRGDASPWAEAAWETVAIEASRGRGGWLCVEPFAAGAFVAGGRAGAPLALLEPGREGARAPGWRLRDLGPAAWAMSIEPLDLDGDGDLDLLVSDRDPPQRGVRWLEQPGPAGPSGAVWRSHPLLATAEPVFFLDRRGFAAKGVGEIVATVAPLALERLELRGGRTQRRERIELPAETGMPKAVRYGDFDLDGEVDLAVSFEQATRPNRGVVWLRRGTDGWQARDVSGPRGTKFDRLVPIDLDGDGDLDLATTEETRIGVVWYENPLR